MLSFAVSHFEKVSEVKTVVWIDLIQVYNVEIQVEASVEGDIGADTF